MGPILQSMYLTLQYLEWRRHNLLKPIFDTNHLKVSTIGINSRNLLCKVSDGNKRNWLLKQYGSNQDSFIANEAKIIDFLKKENRENIVPYIYFDSDNQIIYYDFISIIETVDEKLDLFRENSDWKAINQLVIQLGKLLSNIHATNISKLTINDGIPIRDIAQKALRKDAALIDDYYFAFKYWKKTSIIHFDPQLNNIIVLDKNEFKIIDWEMALVGDPMWDVAKIIFSLCKTIADDLFFESPLLLPEIKNAIKVFLEVYSKTSICCTIKIKSFLRIIVKYHDKENGANYISTINKLLD